jgi:hypothetical protein
LFASGEADANAARRMIGGGPKLVSPFSQPRLACIPIKFASGASGNWQKGLHGRSHRSSMRHSSAKQAAPMFSTKNASGMSAIR